MSIRTFNIDLYDNGTKWEAAPSLLPKVSIDGEHNAATLDFNLLMPYGFVYDDFTYFVEYDDGTGVGGRSDEIQLDERTVTSGTEYHLAWDIPYEATTLGTAYVSIEAVKREDDEPVLIIKSMPVRVVFKPGRKLTSAVRETLMKALETIYARISDIADRADRGEFDGEKGDKGDPGDAATINGYNAVTIAGDTSVSVTDNSGTLTFSSHPSWNNVTDKPTDFTPSAHYQDISYIDNSSGYTYPSALYPTTDWDANLKGILSNYGQSIGQLDSTKQGKSITDTGGYYTTDTVEAALQQIGSDLTKRRKTDAELIAEFDAAVTIGGQPFRLEDFVSHPHSRPSAYSFTSAEKEAFNEWTAEHGFIAYSDNELAYGLEGLGSIFTTKDGAAFYLDTTYSDGYVFCDCFYPLRLQASAGFNTEDDPWLWGPTGQSGAIGAILNQYDDYRGSGSLANYTDWALPTRSWVWQGLDGKQTKTIADTGGYFSTDTVEGALQEIGSQLDGLETALTALL